MANQVTVSNNGNVEVVISRAAVTAITTVSSALSATYAVSAGSAAIVTNAAQPNITSVGNLSTLTMAGDIIPALDVTYSLGNATHQWKDLFVSSSTIYIDNNELTINPQGDLLVNNNIVVTEGANVTFSASTITGALYFNTGSTTYATMQYTPDYGDGLRITAPYLSVVSLGTGFQVSGNFDVFNGNISAHGNINIESDNAINVQYGNTLTVNSYILTNYGIVFPDNTVQVTAYTGSGGGNGYTGSQGTQGYTGSQGTAGAAGATGYTGSQGTAGAVGATGYTGSQGTAGAAGATGYTGSQGTQGATGYTGSLGAQGLQGYTGSQGIQGDAGYTGSQGTQGAVGYTGSEGAQGYTGSQGVGYTGSQGTQGYVGSKGNTGQSSSIYDYAAKTTITSGDPGSGHLIWNTSTQLTATSLNISHLTEAGIDIDYLLATLAINDILFLQAKNDSTLYQNFAVTANVVVNTGYITVPVSLTTSTYTFGNNDQLIIIAKQPGAQGPIGYTGSIGAIGYTGSHGVQGDQGYTGSQGLSGYVGSQGDIGYVGSQGDTGYVGSAGTSGSQGPIGYTGSAGSFDQNLNTFDSVTFAGITSTGTFTAVSANIGGGALYFNNGSTTYATMEYTPDYGSGLRITVPYLSVVSVGTGFQVSGNFDVFSGDISAHGNINIESDNAINVQYGNTLTVNAYVATSQGIKFPDNTIQTTAQPLTNYDFGVIGVSVTDLNQLTLQLLPYDFGTIALPAIAKLDLGTF